MPHCSPLKRKFFVFVAGALVAISAPPAARADEKLTYPQPPTSEQTDDYFGTKVRDPYRPLEDVDAEPTRKWIEAENKITFDYLAKIPERKRINERLTALWNYERYGVPFHEGGNYFFSKNTGLQNQSVLYVAPKLPGESRTLLDPNLLSSDGTVALSGVAVPDDGKLLAYGLATAGSDWQEWKVRDIASGKDLDDDLKWVKFSGASWAHDGSGFFYSRYDEPKGEEMLKGTNYFQKVFYHKIGTPQSDDALVYERKDHKDWLFGGEVTEDGAYLIITVSQGTDPKNRVFYKDLRERDAKVVELLNKQDAAYDFIEHDGSLFWFKTDLQAARGRIIAIDVAHPDQIRELVPESARTRKHFIPTSALPSRRRFIVTISRLARARRFSGRRSISNPMITRPNRSFTKARTAPAYRCS
jgi:prolyl oligopeptidase